MEKGKYNILNFKLYYIIQGNYIFYEVDFKNSSERNALCDFCDYLNGFRNSPA